MYNYTKSPANDRLNKTANHFFKYESPELLRKDILNNSQVFNKSTI